MGELNAWERAEKHLRWLATGPLLVRLVDYDPPMRACLDLTHQMGTPLQRAEICAANGAFQRTIDAEQKGGTE